MRGLATRARITAMIETSTSVTVIHGAMLSFETVEAREATEAPARVREHHETLLRVIDGIVTLELDGSERRLMREGEARIESGAVHRLWSCGDDDARIVQEFRRVA
jgi:mannose-6-phosphate isomerase-like protein (cupin superfamily)